MLKKLLLASLPLAAQDAGILDARIQELVGVHVEKALDFRHYVHQNPELSNREHETARMEDFAYFANEVPGVFYRLGIDREGETNGPHHSPKFRAVPIGMRAMSNVLMDYFIITNARRQ